MSFANPWGLLGLLAIPAIVVIHLYHRRYPVLPVAGLHLWGVETTVRAAGRTRETLPITASLILELLAALLLTAALARPRFGGETALQHLVVVLDNSASMSARPPGEASFREAAIVTIRRQLDAYGRRGVVTILLTGPRPTMLAGPAVSWDDARVKLDAWRPELARHEFGPAWDLAAQLADEASGFLFVTDQLPAKNEAMPKAMETIAVGRALANVSLSSTRWTFDSKAGKGNIFLRIDNRGPQAVDVLVTGTSGERTIFRKTLSLAKEGSAPLEAEVPGGLGRIDLLATASGDGLELDSRATLIEPQVRSVSVAVTLPSDDGATATVRRVLKALPDLQPDDAEKARLIIGRAGELPPSRRDLWWLGLGPVNGVEDARKKAVDLSDRTPYLLDKRHPLLSGLALSGIVWGGVQPLPFESTPLVSSGPHVLLSQLSGTQTTAFVLNIDLGRSNLAESPDWPILLSNLVEQRRDALPGLRQWNYRINEQIRFRLYEGKGEAGDDSPLILKRGESSKPLARAAVVEIPAVDETGVYEIRDGERLVGRFAVNFFDAAESNLSRLDSGTRPPTEPPTEKRYRFDNPYSWLTLLALALILAAALGDWRVLRGRSS